MYSIPLTISQVGSQLEIELFGFEILLETKDKSQFKLKIYTCQY